MTRFWNNLHQVRSKLKVACIHKSNADNIIYHDKYWNKVNIPYIWGLLSFPSFGIQLSIHWMITSCCACVGIRNNNKFSQFITYLQVVPTEINFVVNTIYNSIFILICDWRWLRTVGVSCSLNVLTVGHRTIVWGSKFQWMIDWVRKEHSLWVVVILCSS